jgi:ribulose-phosphate 3-epimerase
VSWREWARGVEIEPSIYAADFLRLGEQLEQLLAAGTRIFHFDVGDGHFVPPVTIGPVVLRSIAPLVHAAGGVLDCHLMVDDPVHHFDELASSGADSVTFHVEATDDPAAVIAAARRHGLGVGVACKPATSIEAAVTAAEGADLLLCMSIEPGYSGQAFMPDALPRVQRTRELVGDALHVQVDGGVGPENVWAIRAAGADLLVAGTSIFDHADPAAAYLALNTAVS